MGARGLTAAGAGGISLVTALVFWPAVSYEFLRFWDDGAHLIWNEAYKGLTPTHLAWMLTPFLGQWMPLTWLSWAIDFRLWGLDPAAFHRTNVLLHALNAGLFFLVARRVLRAALPQSRNTFLVVMAAVTAGFWALHPMRVESVAWINERRDVLSGFFYLLAILTYFKGVMPHPPDELQLPTLHVETNWEHPDTGGRIRLTNTRWLAISIFCFALAVLSKALAVTLPVGLLLLDYYPLGRHRFYREKIPYFAISVVGVVMAFISLARMDVIAPIGWISLEDRVLIGAYSLAFYPVTSLWPTDLSPLYELTFRPTLFTLKYGLPLLGVTLATLLAIRIRARWPAWSVAWAAYAVAVLPISGIVQNGYQLVALRYSYLATLPLALLVGGLLGRCHPRVALLMGAASVGALAVATGFYLPIFHDATAFWSRAVHVEPSCVACADALVHQGDLGHARTILADVVARHPTLQEQRWQLGMVAFIRARGAEGELHFKEYLRQAELHDPGYIPRIEIGRQQHVALARHVLKGPQRTDLEQFDGAIHGLLPR